MFSVIIILLAMVLASMGLAIVIKKKTEECLPVVFLGTIVVLYVFYCLNFLHVGRFFVYAALLELIIMGAILFFKSDDLKKNFFKDYFTLPLAIFIGLSIAILIFAYNLKPNLWDELRLWAASPKAMFYIGKLQLGNNAVLYPEMQSYPPGMALLAYFFTSISGKYFDAAPFIAMVILGFSFIISGLKKVVWKMWPICAAIVVVVILMPCILTAGSSDMGGDWAYYYLTLFIDMILGTLAGYALFLAIKNPFKNWFSTIRFSLCLFVLPSFKNTGAFFAGIIFLVALVITLLDLKGNTKRVTTGHTKRALITYMVVSALSIALSYFSWQILINAKGSGEYANIFAFSITKDVLEVFKNAFTTWGKIPLPFFFIAFLILDILITFLAKDISKRDMLIAMIGILVMCIIFYVGYLNTYSDYFTSLLRYSSVLTFMIYVYLFLRFISSIKSFEFGRIKSLQGKIYVRRFLTMIIIVACSVALLVTTFVSLGLWKKNVHKNNTYKKAKQISRDINRQVSEIDKAEEFSIKEPAKVYIVFKGIYKKNSLFHETCLYESIGTLGYIKNVSYDNVVMFSDTEEKALYEKASENDKESAAKISELLKARLAKEEYDFIYIYDVAELEENIIKEVLGTNENLKKGVLYSLK